jgi:uncharacterized FAD-dependent dehydrogenase
MIRINQIKIQHQNKELSDNELRRVLVKKAAGLLRVRENEIREIRIIKHSIDARKKPQIFHIYVVDVAVAGRRDEDVVKRARDKNVSIAKDVQYDFWRNVKRSDEASNRSAEAGAKRDLRTVVIGMGPAGLFCAYELAANGFRVTVIERGADVDKRQETVERFWKTGELDTQTNVQFGEGGAGTFSDGKLNTVVRDKDGRLSEALEVFVEHGAPEKIKYEAKPHIGTDILRDVVRNMRNRIIENGGEVIFECRAKEILLDEKGHVRGVDTTGGIIECDRAVLAIGHSARDTFKMLREKAVDMQPKAFAVGFRVEHPQSLINKSQYGSEDPKGLPAAPYKLTATTAEGRGVYSFCMCPGGYVVNASSEERMLAVNGMSYSGRDGQNANSAIIITVDPKDFGSDDVLAGVEFQRRLEKKAYELGGGKIPVESYGDFKKAIRGAESSTEESKEDMIPSGFCPQMKGAYEFANVHDILPADLNEAFVEGMESFGRMIKGYNDDRALVSGVESRTSSPVRITRGDDGQSTNIKGLFPCGEGAGYAGGIMSAAMDGIKIAEMVAISMN